MSFEVDVYPRLNPRNGARLFRYTKLQDAEFRRDANGTGGGLTIVRGDEAEAQLLSPKGMDYNLGYDTDTCTTKTLATSAAADDKIDTASAHGLAVGDRVEFTALTGGAGLATGTAYYVVAVPSSTEIQVALTGGAAAINFTTDITAGTLRHLRAQVGWFNDPGDFEAGVARRTRRLKLGGPGALAVLDRFAMPEQTYLDAEGGKDPLASGTDYWNLHLQGTWIGAVPHSLGAYLHRALRECTHADNPRNPFPALTWDFDASVDSNGTPWPVYEGEVVAAIFESLLSVTDKLMRLGLLVEMDPDTFVLHAYVSRGTVRTGAAWGAGVVRFQAPTDSKIGTGSTKSDAMRGIKASLRRSHLGVGSQGTYQWVNDASVDLMWLGGFLTEPGDAAALTAAGNAQLAARSAAADASRIRIKYGNNPTLGLYRAGRGGHFDVHDTITQHSGTTGWDWNEAALKVAAITWKKRRAGTKPDVWVDCGSAYRDLESREFQVAPVGPHSHLPNPRLCVITECVDLTAAQLFSGLAANGDAENISGGQWSNGGHLTSHRHAGARGYGLASGAGSVDFIYTFAPAQVFEGVRYVLDIWNSQGQLHTSGTAYFGVAGGDEEIVAIADIPILEQEIGADGNNWAHRRLCWTPTANRTGVRVRWQSVQVPPGPDRHALDDLALYTTPITGDALDAARCGHGHYAREVRVEPTPSLAQTNVQAALEDHEDRIDDLEAGIGTGFITRTDGTEDVTVVAASGAAHTIENPTANIQDITLTANCTVTMPPLVDGKSFTVRLRQDGTGGRTATFTDVEWPGGTAPTLSVDPNAVDMLAFHSDGVVWFGNYAGAGASNGDLIWRPVMAQDPSDNTWHVVVDGAGSAVMAEA